MLRIVAPLVQFGSKFRQLWKKITQAAMKEVLKTVPKLKTEVPVRVGGMRIEELATVVEELVNVAGRVVKMVWIQLMEMAVG